MKRMNVFVLLLSAFLVPIACAQPQGPSPAGASATSPIQSSEKVLVVIRDKSGMPIQGLTPEEITIIDNGNPTKTLSVEPADKLPIRLGIILISNAATFKAQQETSLQLLAALRPSIDQAFVLNNWTCSWVSAQACPDVKYGNTPTLAWNSDLQTQATAIRSLHWSTVTESESGFANKMLGLDGDQLFRRIIIEFRDPGAEGLENSEFENREQRTWTESMEDRQVKEIATLQQVKTQAYIFAIEDPFVANTPLMQGGVDPAMNGQGARGLAQWDNDKKRAYKDGQVRLERLASSTGGRFVLGVHGFKSGVSEFQKDLQSQYVLTFMPGVPDPNNTAHTIEVRTTRKDAKIIVQKQFYPGVR